VAGANDQNAPAAEATPVVWELRGPSVTLHTSPVALT